MIWPQENSNSITSEQIDAVKDALHYMKAKPRSYSTSLSLYVHYLQSTIAYADMCCRFSTHTVARYMIRTSILILLRRTVTGVKIAPHPLWNYTMPPGAVEPDLYVFQTLVVHIRRTCAITNPISLYRNTREFKKDQGHKYSMLNFLRETLEGGFTGDFPWEMQPWTKQSMTNYKCISKILRIITNVLHIGESLQQYHLALEIVFGALRIYWTIEHIPFSLQAETKTIPQMKTNDQLYKNLRKDLLELACCSRIIAGTELFLWPNIKVGRPLQHGVLSGYHKIV